MSMANKHLDEKLELGYFDYTNSEEPEWEDGMTLAEYKASLPVGFASEHPECMGVYEWHR